MGLMLANQAHNSDGGKREKIDAARVHTAQQALAAIVNNPLRPASSYAACNVVGVFTLTSEGWAGPD